MPWTGQLICLYSIHKKVCFVFYLSICKSFWKFYTLKTGPSYAISWKIKKGLYVINKKLKDLYAINRKKQSHWPSFTVLFCTRTEQNTSFICNESQSTHRWNMVAKGDRKLLKATKSHKGLWCQWPPVITLGAKVRSLIAPLICY